MRWNPSCKNNLFLKQSAALYATYYHLQIFIHRPFIPSPRNRTPVTFPSLAICTNAARSCCHVLESYSRISHLPLPSLQVRLILVPPSLALKNLIIWMTTVDRVPRSRGTVTQHLEWKTDRFCTPSEEGDGGCTEVYEHAKVLRETVCFTFVCSVFLALKCRRWSQAGRYW